MDSIDIDKLEETHRRATPKRWQWWTANSQAHLRTEDHAIVAQAVVHPRDGVPSIQISESDRDLIAELRNAAPELFVSYRRLGDLVRTLKPLADEIRALRARPCAGPCNAEAPCDNCIDIEDLSAHAADALLELFPPQAEASHAA